VNWISISHIKGSFRISSHSLGQPLWIHTDRYKYTYERRKWKKKGEEKKSQAGDDDVEIVTD